MGSLTERQRSIIAGCLLGDGTMRCKENALLEINHAYSQKEYVDWKYSELRRFVTTPPKIRNGNNARIAYRFTTKSLPALTKIYNQFYHNGSKRIPKDVNLRPISLAIWFMDDGNKSHRALYLNTQRFSIADQYKLIKMLKEQSGLKAYLNRDKQYYRLRIAVSSVPRFKRIVGRHMLKMFEYKIPL